ncbi:MAG: 50S ribosomal protein L6, partial [Gammaproteobacteria bacterium]|nr:50S ribosomal protein L6 [Gammaproteobacteria bacterium]NIR98476.1 50S ribosomal protein L6 [Gammaproteobacteria bacterium]NIT64217.1 50S ribosomal protein L6 [Gammaproteobacteria bacterium]NIV21164.1 50S ribosomal protein L6 [Gammaproteobacteria bacterium]NIX10729.1 50S ribosomal protein L6 [Gammaproteobacteria bacterium]
AVPQGVNVAYQEREIHIKGPRGEHRYAVPQPVELNIDDGTIHVQADYVNDAAARRMMGTVQSVLQNMVTGVSEG